MRRWLLAFAAFAVPQFAKADDATAVVTKDGIEFKSGTAVAAKYSTDPKNSKPFLYPVYAPGNVPVTRSWPIEPGLPGEATNDHPHQKSAWFCHGDLIPEGIELKIKTTDPLGKGADFWNESKAADGTPRHGKMKVVKVGEPKVSKDGVSVETVNEWFTPDGVKILDETRTIHFRETPEGRLFTFDIVLKANVCPITFGDTKEGSFGVRVHDSLRPQVAGGGTVTSAEGIIVTAPKKGELPVWGRPAAWMDYSGKVNDKLVGITVFDHPSNPQGSWHTRDYGLNAVNPFAREQSGYPSQKGKTDLIKLPKGGELKLKYAIYTHTGDAKAGKVAEAYESFKK